MTLHRILLLLGLNSIMVVSVLSLMHHNAFISNVWWGLLVALVVAESHTHLMHVQRLVQVVLRILLKVLVIIHCNVHFDFRVAAVYEMLIPGLSNHVVW
jgi:hypothetical protein